MQSKTHTNMMSFYICFNELGFLHVSYLLVEERTTSCFIQWNNIPSSPRSFIDNESGFYRILTRTLDSYKQFALLCSRRVNKIHLYQTLLYPWWICIGSSKPINTNRHIHRNTNTHINEHTNSRSVMMLWFSVSRSILNRVTCKFNRRQILSGSLAGPARALLAYNLHVRKINETIAVKSKPQ